MAALQCRSSLASATHHPSSDRSAACSSQRHVALSSSTLSRSDSLGTRLSTRVPSRRLGPDSRGTHIRRSNLHHRSRGAAFFVRASLKALIFDCDGVILESEDLHRQAYNAAFEEFRVRCPGETKGPVHWSTAFYDVLQNTIGGGKPKMRWYFNKNGWPHSRLTQRPPTTDEERGRLIDTLQDWKSEKYQQLIGSGTVPTRPGVLELMDEARQLGLLVAVCSAATKSSVIFTLSSLLGPERFERLDCFMAGDDVPKKKPDPIIYKLAAQRLGVNPSECCVVEDSVIGLQAALGAGMPCLITHTSSTKEQDFSGAIKILPSLEGVKVSQLEELIRVAQPLAA